MNRPFSLAAAVCVVWTSVALAQDPMPEIIAHRGASHDAPENTLAAFKLAWQQGADGIEGDFRLTLDGHIVCSHDATTRRTGDRELEVYLSRLDELRQVDAGLWRGDAWKGERLPTIEEVLAVVPPGKKIYVEIYHPATVHVLKKAVDASSLRPEQVVVISFERTAVAAAKKLLAPCKAYWIVRLRSDEKTKKLTPTMDELLAGLKECRADGVDCIDHDEVDAAFVRRIKDAGYSFHVWTVDEGDRARRFRDLGADSITTNRPRWIRDQLRGQAGL